MMAENVKAIAATLMALTLHYKVVYYLQLAIRMEVEE